MKPSKARRKLGRMAQIEASRLSRTLDSVTAIQSRGCLPSQQKTYQRQWVYTPGSVYTVSLAGQSFTARIPKLTYNMRPVKGSNAQVCFGDNQERIAKAKASRMVSRRVIGC